MWIGGFCFLLFLTSEPLFRLGPAPQRKEAQHQLLVALVLGNVCSPPDLQKLLVVGQALNRVNVGAAKHGAPNLYASMTRLGGAGQHTA